VKRSLSLSSNGGARNRWRSHGGAGDGGDATVARGRGLASVVPHYRVRVKVSMRDSLPTRIEEVSRGRGGGISDSMVGQRRPEDTIHKG
jgi:hypothetical protein